MAKVAGGEYEILPHSLLEDLKYDVGALKKKLQEPDTKTNELILEIESLKDSIHELNEVFKKALDTTADEDVFKAVKNLNERIDAVVTQNETIARGMIAISDKVDQFISSSSSSAQSRMPSSSAMSVSPTAPSMPRAAVQTNVMGAAHSGIPPPPSMGMPSPASIGGMPPPPPGPAAKQGKRHGFF
ncbi:hypothetical protein CL619_04825 [archaeon]|nr:hypothetical protein [archaeon]